MFTNDKFKLSLTKDAHSVQTVTADVALKQPIQ